VHRFTVCLGFAGSCEVAIVDMVRMAHPTSLIFAFPIGVPMRPAGA